MLGSFEAVSGKTWNPPVLYGNVLLVRNGLEATRLETRDRWMKAESSSSGFVRMI